MLLVSLGWLCLLGPFVSGILAVHSSPAAVPPIAVPQAAKLKRDAPNPIQNDSHAIDYPQTRRDDNIVDIYLGHVAIGDPYQWLEVANSTETQKFVSDQDALFNQYISMLPQSTAKQVSDAVTAAYLVDIIDLPTLEGTGENQYYYWRAKAANLDQWQMFRSRSHDLTDPELFFDENKLSTDGSVSKGRGDFSNDGVYYAYTLFKDGSDLRAIHIKPTKGGLDAQPLPEVLEGVKFSTTTWLPDNGSLIYQRWPDLSGDTDTATGPNSHPGLWLHKVSTPQSQDVLVYTDDEHPDNVLQFAVTSDGKYLTLFSFPGSTPSNSLAIVDLSTKQSLADAFKSKIMIRSDYTSFVDVVHNVGTNFTLMTDADGAANLKLVTIDLAEGPAYPFHELVPETKYPLDTAAVVDTDTIAVVYKKDVLQEMFLLDAHTGATKTKVALPVGLSIEKWYGRSDGQEIFLYMDGFVAPGSVYRYDVRTAKLSLVLEPSATGLSPEDYVTEQVFYRSQSDNTHVPMFIIGRKDLPRNASRPCILYAYGGFDFSIYPFYDPFFAVMLQHLGGRVAVANVRGGGEYGQAWWNAARQENRQTAFDDYRSATSFLFANNYTQPSELIAWGQSNGGLLVAVAANQYPEDFAAVVADGALLDMLRYDRFTIGKAWETEFGDPNDPEYFPWLRAYSPLHNVRVHEQDVVYPAILATASEGDDRVVPAHTYKYMAELQHQALAKRAAAGQGGKEGGPFLCQINSHAGHDGGTTLTSYIQLTISRVKFVMLALGLTLEA